MNDTTHYNKMKLFRSNISISKRVSINSPLLIENTPVLSPWVGKKSQKMVLPLELDCLGLLQIQKEQVLGLYTSMIFEMTPPFAKIKPDELGMILQKAMQKEGFEDCSKVYALSADGTKGWKRSINFLNNRSYNVEHIELNPKIKRCWCSLKFPGTINVKLLTD